MVELSIIVPGVRKENWDLLYQQTEQACKNHTFEMIFAGPHQPSDFLLSKSNVSSIIDFGTPSRCLQIAAANVKGKFITWLADDAHVIENSIDSALELLKSKNAEKDIICMRYIEGENRNGNPANFADFYWVAWTHPDLQLEGVEKSWKIPCVMMISSDYFRNMGGLDCDFEHINFNVHDLAFRSQRNGSVVHMSPDFIMNCDWEPHRNASNSPVIAAYPSDKARFQSKYFSKYEVSKNPIRIDFNNWKNSPEKWFRRFR
jgi:hypothetical protein